MFYALLAVAVAPPLEPWPVHFSYDGRPFVRIPVGGTSLDLLLDTQSAQTAVVQCSRRRSNHCYKTTSDVQICAENAWAATEDDPKRGMCFPGERLKCSKPYLPTFESYQVWFTSIFFDGLLFLEKGWEAREHMGAHDVMSPIKVLRHAPELAPVAGKDVSFAWPYFSSAQYFPPTFGGLFGIAPSSISCRTSSYWGNFVATSGIEVFVLDFDFPSIAVFKPPGATGRPLVERSFNASMNPSVSANAAVRWLRSSAFSATAEVGNSVIEFEVSKQWARDVLYSQEKQTGDRVNNGRYEFLIFRPQTCGTDLLYNVSSNWLAVVDTRGRCLSLPPFMWEAFVAWLGKSVECSRKRGGMCRVIVAPEHLPIFSFALSDRDDAPRIELQLEQLVIKSGDKLFLCVARAEDSQVDNPIAAQCPDSDGTYQFQSIPPSADMTEQQIGFGSLVVSALYTVIDLKRGRVGFAVKYPKSVKTQNANTTCPESTRYLCGLQQTYYPPLNKCLDPVCEHYIFLTLNPDAHTCVWMPGFGLGVGVILVALVIAEIVNERLYARVLEKAKYLWQRDL
eukprot:GEMP01037613.1.p1 GENE.GEMP01037613.1~~GEMP01037613.1.p1  ORF type:complete len:565 (+),score=115.89 GEMP01037613.1:117-1811(+)